VAPPSAARLPAAPRWPPRAAPSAFNPAAAQRARSAPAAARGHPAPPAPLAAAASSSASAAPSDLELIQSVRRDALEPKTIAQYRNTFNHYVADCAQRDVPPLPATPASITAFIIRKCRAVGNTVSADVWATNVRRHVVTTYGHA
jgi:hypothetical protein